MKLHFYFRNIGKFSRDRLRDYLTEKKLNRLTRLLKDNESSDLASLALRVECLPNRTFFTVKLDLILTNKRDLMAQESGRKLIETFDLAFDCLVLKLRRYKGWQYDKTRHRIRHAEKKTAEILEVVSPGR
ncbi:MAG: HPF/RaiA family ribosome-associated protein [Candidatus Nealsonbacteria bacterium]|nr:HPF/RaiA family ribosome-associated protein [Candidatus Nealsonbacteria bacterium]